MYSTILRNHESIQEFYINFGRLCRNPIDIGYFLSADVIRAFYKDGRMIGGYIVNTRLPLRYHQMIPEPSRSEESVSRYFENGSACEITCLWLIRARLTAQERNNVYLYSACDALSMRTTRIFGGSVNVKLARTQKRVMPNVIYRGPWNFEGSPASAQVYCANWWQLLILIAIAYSYTTTTDLVNRVHLAVRRARRKRKSVHAARSRVTLIERLKSTPTVAGSLSAAFAGRRVLGSGTRSATPSMRYWTKLNGGAPYATTRRG